MTTPAEPIRGYFVTGTDTGAGKTLVSAALLRRFAAAGRRVAGMKPVASGAIATAHGLRNEDALVLARESSPRPEYALVNPYAFAPSIAPHLAARAAGVVIDPERILAAFHALAAKADLVLVEGVGGWRVPLGPDLDVARLAARLGLPVILVVGLKLGCLSHAILTAEAIRADGLPFAGWVGTGIDPGFEEVEANLATLREVLPAPCLGHVPPLGSADVRTAAGCLDLARLA
jgi:dethiobiotin synthetase